MNTCLDCRLSLYADDSALLFSHRDSRFIGNRLSHELAKCKQWLDDNKLSLHIGKTECLLFGSRRKLKGTEGFQVTCEGKVIDRVFCVKYLGVFLDSCLSGAAQAANVMKVCTGRLAFLYRNASLLDQNCRRLLCSALIQPYLDYCRSTWYSGLSVALKGKLDVIQRKMVRYVQGMDIRQHVGVAELRSLSWLSIPDRVAFFKLVHLFRIRNNLAPRYLMINFVSVSNAHSHLTRGSGYNYRISRDLAQAPHGFAFTAIKQWNSLPSYLKEICGLKVFKRRLKEFFFSRYN